MAAKTTVATVLVTFPFSPVNLREGGEASVGEEPAVVPGNDTWKRGR